MAASYSSLHPFLTLNTSPMLYYMKLDSYLARVYDESIKYEEVGKVTARIIRCQDCGKVISTRFPLHNCTLEGKMTQQYYRPHNTYTPRITKPYHCRVCENGNKRVAFETHEELLAHREKNHK